jgi:periplasmic protein TonB
VRTILAVAAASILFGQPAFSQSGDDPVYQIGNGVTAPVIIKEVKPNYTPDAIRRKVQGTVQVSAVVLTDGTVGEVHVTKSLDLDLDEQAIIATKQWRFKPGTKDGQPVNVRVTIELTFSLRDSRR